MGGVEAIPIRYTTLDDTYSTFGGIALTSHEELFSLAANLKKVADDTETDQISKPLAALEDAAKTIGRSFSGSWQGYHSRVYYEGFSPPPPGAHFSQEWGLMDSYMSRLGSHGDWREYDSEEVSVRIHELAGMPSLE